jgi:hypothetical protein
MPDLIASKNHQSGRYRFPSFASMNRRNSLVENGRFRAATCGHFRPSTASLR